MNNLEDGLDYYFSMIQKPMKKNEKNYEILIPPRNCCSMNMFAPLNQEILLSECELCKKMNQEKKKSFLVLPNNSQFIKKQISSHLEEHRKDHVLHSRNMKKIDFNEEYRKGCSLINSFLSKKRIQKSMTKKTIVERVRKNDCLKSKKNQKENQKNLRIQGFKLNKQVDELQKNNPLNIQQKKIQEKSKQKPFKSSDIKLKKNKNENFLKLFVESIQIKYGQGLESYKAVMNFDQSGRKNKKERPATSCGYAAKKQVKQSRPGSSSLKLNTGSDFQTHHLEYKNQNEEKKYFLFTCNK